MPLFHFPADDYHGINGNVSLDRRSEIVQSPNRYELALGSNKSTLSRDNGTYDVGNAELRSTIISENVINNNHHPTTPNGTSTLESQDGEKKKKWPTDRAYYLAKELLMTERTYKKDLDVINHVSFENIFVPTIFCDLQKKGPRPNNKHESHKNNKCLYLYVSSLGILSAYTSLCR